MRLRQAQSATCSKNAPINTLADAVRLGPCRAVGAVPGSDHRPDPHQNESPPAGTGPERPWKREVLALIVQGLSNEEIAERLVISTATALTMSAPVSRSWALPIVWKPRCWEPSTIWSPTTPTRNGRSQTGRNHEVTKSPRTARRLVLLCILVSWCWRSCG